MSETKCSESDLNVLLCVERDKIRKHLFENNISEADKRKIKDCESVIINAAACVEWLAEHYSKIYGA